MKSATSIMARVLSSLLVAAMAPCAWALSVSPPRTEVHLRPGETTTVMMKVANPGPDPVDVEISEKPWFVYPDNKQIQVHDWLKLPKKTEFHLKGGKDKDVTVTIQCPKDAVGELMGMVSFAYQGSQPSMITPMISTAVYLDVTGTEKNDGQITALGAGTRNGRFQTGVQVKATGNIRLRPTGAIQLIDDHGTTVAEYQITDASPIFPGTIKDCEGHGPDKAPAPGHYRLQAELRSGTLGLKAEQGLSINAAGDVQLDSKKEAAQS